LSKEAIFNKLLKKALKNKARLDWALSPNTNKKKVL